MRGEGGGIRNVSKAKKRYDLSQGVGPLLYTNHPEALALLLCDTHTVAPALFPMKLHWILGGCFLRQCVSHTVNLNIMDTASVI